MENVTLEKSLVSQSEKKKKNNTKVRVPAGDFYFSELMQWIHPGLFSYSIKMREDQITETWFNSS